MSSWVSGIYRGIAYAGFEVAYTTEAIASGCIFLKDGTCRILNDMVNIEKGGLSSSLKFFSTAFKLDAFLRGSSFFKNMSDGFDGLVSLYYSANFIKMTSKLINFRDLKFIEIFQVMGSYIYLYQFLIKMDVITINKMAEVSKGVGSGSSYLAQLVADPRSVCIGGASLISIYTSLPSNNGNGFLSNFWNRMSDPSYLLKFVANVGKVTGLLLAPIKEFGKETHFGKILPVITFGATLAKYLIDCSRERNIDNLPHTVPKLGLVNSN